MKPDQVSPARRFALHNALQKVPKPATASQLSKPAPTNLTMNSDSGQASPALSSSHISNSNMDQTAQQTTPHSDSDSRPEDPMDWKPTIPPSLPEDILYEVICHRLDADLRDLCKNPNPRGFFQKDPIPYHTSISTLSRVNRCALKLTHRIVQDHQRRALEQRGNLFGQLREKYLATSLSRDLDHFNTLTIQDFMSASMLPTRELATVIKRADEALEEIWQVRERLTRVLKITMSPKELAKLGVQRASKQECRKQTEDAKQPVQPHTQAPHTYPLMCSYYPSHQSFNVPGGSTTWYKGYINPH